MKKYKHFTIILASALCMSLTSPTLSVSASIGSSLSQDLLIKHSSYIGTESDSYNEYYTVFYTEDSKKLKSILDECHFYKSAGYTEDYLQNFDVDSVFPGFSNASFTKKEFQDDGDYYTFLIWFDDLDVKENFIAAEQMGVISLNEDPETFDFVNGESICDSFGSIFPEVTLLDLTQKGLHFAHLESDSEKAN